MTNPSANDVISMALDALIIGFIAECTLCGVISRILFYHELKIVLGFILNVVCKNLGKV